MRMPPQTPCIPHITYTLHFPTHHTHIFHVSSHFTHTPHINKYTFPHSTHMHTTYLSHSPLHMPHTDIPNIHTTFTYSHTLHMSCISPHAPPLPIHTTACHRYIHSNKSHAPLHTPHSIHVPPIPSIYPHTQTYTHIYITHTNTLHT